MPTIEEQLQRINAVIDKQNDTKIDALINNVKALQVDKDKNSGFEKGIKIISVALIPLAVALAGHLFGRQLKDAEIESAANRSAAELDFQKLKNQSTEKQQKAELILKFVSELSSTDPVRKQIALQAINIALPDEGPRFVNIIMKSDADPTVQEKAKEIYAESSQKLIDSVFSKDKQQRIQATETLINGYSNNTDVYKRIIEKAKTDSNEDGIFNTTLILANANQKNLQVLSPELYTLSNDFEKKGLIKSKVSLQKKVINKIE